MFYRNKLFSSLGHCFDLTNVKQEIIEIHNKMFLKVLFKHLPSEIKIRFVNLDKSYKKVKLKIIF